MSVFEMLGLAGATILTFVIIGGSIVVANELLKRILR